MDAAWPMHKVAMGGRMNCMVSYTAMPEVTTPPGELMYMEIYHKNPAAKDNLRAPIFENKVVDFILELARVNERKVTPEELIKADDEVEQAKPAGKKTPKKEAAAAKASKKATSGKPAAKKAAKKKS